MDLDVIQSFWNQCIVQENQYPYPPQGMLTEIPRKSVGGGGGGGLKTPYLKEKYDDKKDIHKRGGGTN